MGAITIELGKENKIKYSVGDDDMLILELAVEKSMNDRAKANYRLQNAPREFQSAYQTQHDIDEKGTSIAGGSISEAIYLVTGKETSEVRLMEEIEEALNSFNGNNIVLGANVFKNKTVQDINGDKIKLRANHAYAVKDVSKEHNTVTVTNPWDSSKDILLDKNVFLKNFGSINKCDLNSKDVSYVEYPYKTDENGNKYYKTGNNGAKYPNFLGDELDIKDLGTVYDSKGNVIEESYMDENGNKLVEKKYKYNNQGKTYLAELSAFFTESNCSISMIKDKSSNIKYYKAIQLNKQGNITNTKKIKNGSTIKNINERNLLNYAQFSLDEMISLGKLPDKEWKTIKNILDKNKNTSYYDIKKETC